MAALCLVAFLYVPSFEASAEEDRAPTAEERNAAALKALPEDGRLIRALTDAFRALSSCLES